MKRFFLLSLALVLLLSLTACSSRREQPEITESTAASEPTESSAAGTLAPTEHTTPPATTEPALFTFPGDTAVFGVSLEGLRPEEGLTALKKAVSGYIVNISAGSDQLTLSTQDLVLGVDEKAFDSYADALEQNKKADPTGLITMGRAAETADYLAQKLSWPLQEASVSYSSSAGEFTPVSGSTGRSLDRDTVETLLTEAVLAGQPSLSLDAAVSILEPSVSGSEPALQHAAQTANGYLDLELTYTYTPDGGKTSRQSLTKQDLASFLTIGSDFGVYIDEDAIYNYASLMASTYGASGYQDDFRTSNGGTVGYQVDYYGQSVDTGALADDISYCFSNGISGTRQAPYHASGSTAGMAYGGNYIEIDLNNQHLWLYRDGERLVSCPIVSGCVARNDMTPTGIFAVDDRDTDCELVGDDFHMFTDYWIGFWGSYGIHDAPWREGVFGGDIYLYDGSHGCANAPTYDTGLIYDHSYLGMKVIIYGGKTQVDPLKQEILCQDYFDVADDAKPFRLDAKLRYEDEDIKISYQSSNPKVAEVSENGQVTVKGIGKATITLTSPAFTYHTAGRLEVTVNVHSACDEGRHQFGKWTVTKEPTCLPGEETRTCTVCGATETREIPPTGEHTFGEWVVTKEPTCLPGEETRTCTVCGATETREIPPTGEHTFGEWVVTKEPTCLPGEETRTCSVCGATETREIPPTGEHSWGEWITVTEPGCETPGLRKSVCALCGQERTEEIPPMGHAFSPDEEFCLHGCGTRNPDYKPPVQPAVFLPHRALWSRRWYQL